MRGQSRADYQSTGPRGRCRWALRLASDAAVTVLKVDQIIMAKQAGGPKPRAPGPMDDD